MLSGDSLTKILETLREVDGYFVVRDGEEEFVIERKSREINSAQKQLTLPTTESLARDVEEVAHKMDTTPDFILQGINREIAVVRDEALEEEMDDLSLEAAKNETGKKVRFEPITGDLPPELQE